MNSQFLKLLCFALCALTQTVLANYSFAEDGPAISFSPVEGYKLRSPMKVQQFGAFEERNISCEPNPCKHPAFMDGVFRAEGKITQFDYRNLSTPIGELGVLRNFEEAIKKLGGEKINNRKSPEFFHLFKVPQGEKATWVVLKNYDKDAYELTLIEPRAVAQTVTATQLSDAIKKQGFATLYINFDSNKFDLKADGQAAVKEIAAMLKSDSSLKLSVEGHTDNVGDAKANKSLSENRAKAVVQAVVAQGITASRLSAAGFGMEKPVADNRSEEGRGKNRRVELVKQ
jgi:OmpA-OmpF porin, OOP family